MQKKTTRISVGAGQAGGKTHTENKRTLRNANALQASRMTRVKPLTISVDHSTSMNTLVKAGRYTDFSRALLRAPRMKGNGTIRYEARIFHFDEIIGSKDAQKSIEKAGWNVASVEQLLAVGAKLPHLQGQFPIVALGTIWKGAVSEVACLHHGDGPKRYVVLRWIGDDWCGDFAFLAVRPNAAR